MQLYETQPPTIEDHNQARLEILAQCSAFAQAATTTVTGCRVKDFCQAYNRRDPELNISATTYALVPTVHRTTIYRWRRSGQPVAKTYWVNRPPKPTPRQRDQARRAIVQKSQEYRAQNPDRPEQWLLYEFSDLYNRRKLDMPEWVYRAVGKCSRTSICRWKSKSDSQ